MADGDHLRKRPLWVKVGLWGIPNRASAWGFFWFCLIATVACVAYGFVDPRFFVGGLLVFAGAWYFASIRWVDRHGHWS